MRGAPAALAEGVAVDSPAASTTYAPATDPSASRTRASSSPATGWTARRGSSAPLKVSTTCEKGESSQASSATTATFTASTEPVERMGSNMKLNTVASTMGKMSVHMTALGVSSSVRTVALKVVHMALS